MPREIFEMAGWSVEETPAKWNFCSYHKPTYSFSTLQSPAFRHSYRTGHLAKSHTHDHYFSKWQRASSLPYLQLSWKNFISCFPEKASKNSTQRASSNPMNQSLNEMHDLRVHIPVLITFTEDDTGSKISFNYSYFIVSIFVSPTINGVNSTRSRNNI